MGLVSVFAAAVLGIALWHATGSEAALVTPSGHEVGVATTSDAGPPPAGDAYLGTAPDPKEEPQAFTGRVSWDPRGHTGVVHVAVYDSDGDRDEVWFEDYIEGSEWAPTAPLPKRFRVIVEHPADDGFSDERLLCTDYYLP
jgi:hypothetical protein